MSAAFGDLQERQPHWGKIAIVAVGPRKLDLESTANMSPARAVALVEAPVEVLLVVAQLSSLLWCAAQPHRDLGDSALPSLGLHGATSVRKRQGAVGATVLLAPAQ